MLEFLKRDANLTLTDNGAVTYRSSESYCLDLFYKSGAMRNAQEKEIITAFQKAFWEDSDLAMKILFFTRDIRGGLGERHFFRICLNWLGLNYPETIAKNIRYIADFGRYDDYLSLLGTKCEKDMIKEISIQLTQDIATMEEKKENVSLLAKWLPSVNTSNHKAIHDAKRIAKALRMSQETYRKTLSKLRKYIDIIENHLREKDYSFDYEKQVSKALFKYRRAFIRNDEESYLDFLSKVNRGEAVLKTSSLYPYDIVREAFHMEVTYEERLSLDATWNSLAHYGTNENAIVVIDGSGSMYSGNGTPLPYQAAISLGIYFAEHNWGAFRNHFITFSQTPKLIEIKGKDIVDKVRYVSGFNEVANTNLEAVFQLILRTALKNKLPQSELPKTIYIISDMEFDCCMENSSLTNFENMKRMFVEAGYNPPKVVFWNVNSLSNQIPVKMNDQGAALVSGSSPKIFDMMLSGELNPMKLMLDIMGSERYMKIVA